MALIDAYLVHLDEMVANVRLEVDMLYGKEVAEETARRDMRLAELLELQFREDKEQEAVADVFAVTAGQMEACFRACAVDPSPANLAWADRLLTLPEIQTPVLRRVAVTPNGLVPVYEPRPEDFIWGWQGGGLFAMLVGGMWVVIARFAVLGNARLLEPADFQASVCPAPPTGPALALEDGLLVVSFPFPRSERCALRLTALGKCVCDCECVLDLRDVVRLEATLGDGAVDAAAEIARLTAMFVGFDSVQKRIGDCAGPTAVRPVCTP